MQEMTSRTELFINLSCLVHVILPCLYLKRRCCLAGVACTVQVRGIFRAGGRTLPLLSLNTDAKGTVRHLQEPQAAVARPILHGEVKVRQIAQAALR